MKETPKAPGGEPKPAEEVKNAPEEYEQSVIYKLLQDRGKKTKDAAAEADKAEESTEADKAIIAVAHNEADRENVLAEAIEMKADKTANEKKFLGLVIKRVPIIGTIVKAGLMSHYKKQAVAAIDNNNDLTKAYEELKLDAKDSKVLNGNNDKSINRARQLLDSAGYSKDNKVESVSSVLDKDNKVEMVKNQDSIRKALNDYYFEDLKRINKLKENPDDEKAKDEIAKIEESFNEKIKEAIGGEADYEQLKTVINREKAGLEKLAEDRKHNSSKIKKYLENDFTLYKATMREGLYTKKEVDKLAKAVLAGSAIGLATAFLASREASSTTRKAAIALGATGFGAGAAAGAVAGTLRGIDKARVGLSAHEIEQATNFDNKTADKETVAEESAAETKPADGKEGEESADREKKKLTILEKVKKYGVKGMAKGEDRLAELDEKRNRINASDRINAINDLIESINKGEKVEENKTKLEGLLFDTVARGQFSSKKQIDLIRYKDAEERGNLEKTIFEAAKNCIKMEPTPENINNYLAASGELNGIVDKLEKEYKEAQEIEKKYRNRIILVNAVTGAIAGGVAGAVLTEIREKGLFGAAVGAVKGEEDTGGEDVDIDKLREFKGKPVLIENDPDGGMSIGIDKDGDGLIDTDEFIRGEGDTAGIDLTDDQQFEELNKELNGYRIELQREAIETSRYGETSIDNYLENANNTVDTSGGIDWSRSATRVAFGTPTATIEDGMDNYEIPVWGVNGEPIPDGAKFYIDLDGEGPGDTLEYTIENGKAIVPADVLDTSHVGNGGAASFIGTARVGEMDGNTMISYATAFGKDADLSSTISASAEGTGYAFTAVDMDTGEGLSQFAVNADNKIISNMSEIYNGIEVGDSERMPVTFMVKEIGDDANGTTLASGEKIVDLDYKGGYHPEYDSYQNDAFIGSKSYLGTPIKWDLDGDGQMSSAEEATFFKQLLVRTGTDPFVLAQNASNYGLLEPDRLEEIIPRDQLIDWGIKDGTIDNMTDLNVMIEHLKMPENAELYDKLVNSTINEMQGQMDGGSFTVETITDRASTYTNSSHEIDAWRGSNARTILYARNKNGEIVGNQGVVCGTLGIKGGKVGTLTDCGGQTGGSLVHEKTTSEKTTSEKSTSEKTTSEKTTSEKSTSEKTTSEDTVEPKDYDNMRRIDDNIDKELENNYGTDDIQHHTDLGTTEPTEQPSGDDYQGTGPSTTPNDSSSTAAPVQDSVSTGNNYSNDNGGSHESKYSPNTNNDSGQSSANAGEKPIESAPSNGDASFEKEMEELNQ